MGGQARRCGRDVHSGIDQGMAEEEGQEVIFTENTAPDREIWDEKALAPQRPIAGGIRAVRSRIRGGIGEDLGPREDH